MTRNQVTNDILQIKSNNILCELPTSFGKSKIALELLTAKNITADNKILVVIPRNVLIQNWKEEFIKWGKTDYLKSVTFVTYVSLPKKTGKWDFVIFDECHHLSERCRESLLSFDIKYSILLSATVKKELKASLYSLFPNLYTYTVHIKQATEEGILPDPKVYLIPLQLDNTVLKNTIIKNPSKSNPLTIPYKDRWKYKDVKNRQIRIICTQQQYYSDITSFIEWCRPKIHNPMFKNMFLRKSGDRLKWLSDQKISFIQSLLDLLHKERTLTFCNSIAQTEVLGTYCINSKSRQSKGFLSMFNEGIIHHITACDMLNEGVNLKGCRIGIYASLNSSERIIKQKLGRLLRHPDPILIIPYYSHTREEEIVKKMCEDYNPELIKTITDIKQLKL